MCAWYNEIELAAINKLGDVRAGRANAVG